MNMEDFERIENGEVVWLKNKPTDKISWKHNNEDNIVFRFEDNPEIEYCLYRDYYKLTPSQKAIFDKENPFWKKWFSKK